MVELGSYNNQRASDRVTDLGDVAILPGLINAHTHLEFSDFETPIGTPGLSLPDWIGRVVQHRQQIPSTAGTSSSLTTRAAAIAMGLRESAMHGVAVVGEIATIGTSPNDFQLELNNRFPFVYCFTEVLGLTDARADQCCDWANSFHHALSSSSMKGDKASCHSQQAIQLGYSPHAPYSVPVDLLASVVRRSQKLGCSIAMHVAESTEEMELVETGRGPFSDLVTRFAPASASLFPIQGGLLRILEILSKSPRCLLVHGNYLNPLQIQYIASHPHFSVVYCPRTHHFFGHSRHPLTQLLELGINVCLGTDSRASNPDLSIWKEAQFMRATRPELSPINLLRMITVNAAKALGVDPFGTIAVGRPAKLIQVSLTSQTSDPNQLLEGIFELTPKSIK